MKYIVIRLQLVAVNGRSPQGERGLKSHLHVIIIARATSLPARGARIEMDVRDVLRQLDTSSLPARGARIEIALPSHPPPNLPRVAPRKGSAD